MVKNFSNKIEQGQMIVQQIWLLIKLVRQVLIGVQFRPDRFGCGGKVDLSSGSTQIGQLYLRSGPIYVVVEMHKKFSL